MLFTNPPLQVLSKYKKGLMVDKHEKNELDDDIHLRA